MHRVLLGGLLRDVMVGIASRGVLAVTAGVVRPPVWIEAAVVPTMNRARVVLRLGSGAHRRAIGTLARPIDPFLVLPVVVLSVLAQLRRLG